MSELQEKLLSCCHSQTWCEKLITLFPFSNTEELKKSSEEVWFNLSESDWLEAFKAHPQIGDMNSLKEKYSKTKETSSKEQSGVASACDQTLNELHELNLEYEKKFGFIFIVCATGKSAQEMLKILKSRINNSRDEELKNAATEQNKITHLRMENIRWE